MTILLAIEPLCSCIKHVGCFPTKTPSKPNLRLLTWCCQGQHPTKGQTQ